MDITNKEIEWLTNNPKESLSEIAILVPHFNEAHNYGYFLQRLDYYNNMAHTFKGEVDVILVDDGSRDESNQIILEYLNGNSCSFFSARVTPNANKIGALYVALQNIPHNLIMFSDFDTDIFGLEHLKDDCKVLEDETLMGLYLRMYPYPVRNNMIVAYQSIEYSFHRAWDKFHMHHGDVAVMPGAGSVFKRSLMESFLRQHSGLRNGEDRESCIIGQKLGFKASVAKNVYILTRTPQRYTALLEQRYRWNLGYFETLFFEKMFYIKQVRGIKLLGFRTLFELFDVAGNVLSPVIVAALLYFNLILVLPLVVYPLRVCWIIFWLNYANDPRERKNRNYFAIMLYPLIRVLVEAPSWWVTIKRITVNVFSKKYAKILTSKAAYGDWTISLDKVADKESLTPISNSKK